MVDFAQSNKADSEPTVTAQQCCHPCTDSFLDSFIDFLTTQPLYLSVCVLSLSSWFKFLLYHVA